MKVVLKFEEDGTLLEYESNDEGGAEIPVVDSDDE
jgi:hypothetical protein